MKFLMICVLAMSATAFANHHEGPEPTFEEMKKTTLANIDKRIETLQTAKTCVGAAADKPAMHTCRQAMKAANDALRPKHHKKPHPKHDKKKK